MYGIEKLLHDLQSIGYEGHEPLIDIQGVQYGLIKNYEIPSGSFKGRIVDLAIPAPTDYPRVLGASIHIKANPHLVPFGPIPNLRNVIPSNLGPEWQYWSYQFHKRSEQSNHTLELITQINGIFKIN
jgi:hypothetical protein